MRSTASRSRKRASFAVVASVAVVASSLGAGWSRAQASEAPAAPGAVAEAPKSAVRPPAVRQAAGPFADRFPNVVLRTHEGRNVRFYDDLLEGKIVLINFMYATCKER